MNDKINKYKCVRSSKDLSTNKWRVKCTCGYVFNPPTTALATQIVHCPKCHKEESVNYNEITESTDI